MAVAAASTARRGSRRRKQGSSSARRARGRRGPSFFSGSDWRRTAAVGVFAVVGLMLVGGVRSTFDEDHAVAFEVNTGRGRLLSAETTSLINLLTACLLLFIVWTVLAPILDGTVSIVRNDDRRFAGIYGNRRFDDNDAAANAAYYNYYGDDTGGGGGGGYYDGQDSSSTAAAELNNEQYYGTNFEENGPGVGYYSSSDGGLPISQIEGVSTTGWEYAARGFEDGLTKLFDGAINSFESDVTNSAFDLMDIQPRVCREKAVCEAEIQAKESYVFGNIMKLTRAFASGFENYREAQAHGRAGHDCDSLYYACPHSYKSSMFAKYFK